jgi:outer membrane murein-binding lipoprotein Lpp
VNSEQLTGVVEELTGQVNELQHKVKALEDKQNINAEAVTQVPPPVQG